MGAIFACLMDEEGLDRHERERLDKLLRGASFGRTKFSALGLALATEKVIVRLNEDRTTVVWRNADCRGASNYGSVKVTDIEAVKATGAMGLTLLGKAQKNELELEAEDVATRDTWLIAMNEVVERSKETGKHGEAERETQAAEEASNKRAYWSSRKQELRAGEKAAAEKKAKYASAGMNFTARAMTRSNS